MRMFLPIIVLLPLHSCHSDMSVRGTVGDSDLTGHTNPCAGQTSPSPICPEMDEPTPAPTLTATPTEDGERDGTGTTLLTEYHDDKYGYITVFPLNVAKAGGDLEVVFTATKAITSCRNFSITYLKREDFELHDMTTLTAKSAGISVQVRAKGGVEVCKMVPDDKFTVTFSITPVDSFDFKFGYSGTYFRNSRRDLPRITVYGGGTPPTPPPPPPLYTGPVYKVQSDKLRLMIAPFPHRLSQNGGELTLTFTANRDMPIKSISPTYGQRRHRYELALGRPADGDFLGSDVSALGMSKISGSVSVTTTCTAPGAENRCPISILEMDKGQSFTLKLRVTAKKSFKLLGFTKIADGLHLELDGKAPVIKVE